MAVARNALFCVGARRRGLTFPQSRAILSYPIRVGRGDRHCRVNLCRWSPPCCHRLADGLWIAGFLFSSGKFDFSRFWCRLCDLFSECLPIPGKVKGRRWKSVPPAFLRPRSCLLSSVPSFMGHHDVSLSAWDAVRASGSDDLPVFIQPSPFRAL